MTGLTLDVRPPQDLASLEELPAQYRARLARSNLTPLWPSLRALLPAARPANRTRPALWSYAEARPLLIEAGQLAPIERAERRVLVLANPGLGLDSLQATPAIYLGLQLILPGEVAPSHRHTPSAARIVIEGEGAYTTVDGHRCAMEPGDLILTPGGHWHEHGHAGAGPCIWLDVLDLMLMHFLEVSYHEPGRAPIVIGVEDDAQGRYTHGGVVPAPDFARSVSACPRLRFPWRETRAALDASARARTPGSAPAQVAYVNPESGGDCLATLGLSALRLEPGMSHGFPVRSAATVFHVVEGEGSAHIDADVLDWRAHDTFCAPSHAAIALRSRDAVPGYLVIADEGPLQRRLGVYEQRPGPP
jgi:gentisate 1,2-dioxygenase